MTFAIGYLLGLLTLPAVAAVRLWRRRPAGQTSIEHVGETLIVTKNGEHVC